MKVGLVPLFPNTDLVLWKCFLFELSEVTCKPVNFVAGPSDYSCKEPGLTLICVQDDFGFQKTVRPMMSLFECVIGASDLTSSKLVSSNLFKVSPTSAALVKQLCLESSWTSLSLAVHLQCVRESLDSTFEMHSEPNHFVVTTGVQAPMSLA